MPADGWHGAPMAIVPSVSSRLPRDSSMATFTVRVCTMGVGLGVGRVTSVPRPAVIGSGVRTSRPMNTPNANSAMPVRIAATGLNGSLEERDAGAIGVAISRGQTGRAANADAPTAPDAASGAPTRWPQLAQ